MTPTPPLPDYADVPAAPGLVVAGRTGVKVSGGQVYLNPGDPTPVAVEFRSSTRCSLSLDLLQRLGPRTGVGVQVTPEETSPIASVRNVFRVGSIQGFDVGVRIGVGNRKACDENMIVDSTIASCGVGVLVDGGNAQLQYLDRVRIENCTTAAVSCRIGGVHLTNCSLNYCPVGVLVGTANPYVVLTDVYAEGGLPPMVYLATTTNSNNPGTCIIRGGASMCRGPATVKKPDGGDYPWVSICWNHNAPLVIEGHDLGGPILVEEGRVTGSVNLTDPTLKPADYFLSRGKATWDVAWSQQQSDGKWKTGKYP